MGLTMSEKKENSQLLHLVFGGELTSLTGVTFRDLDEVDIVGIYPDYKSAEKAWRAKAKEVHPDVRPGDEEAAKAFQAYQVAYEVLRQGEERREWKG